MRSQADEPVDNGAAGVVDDTSLFLAQQDGHVSNDSRTEQHYYEFGSFTSAEVEAGRLASAALGYPIPNIEGDDVVDV